MVLRVTMKRANQPISSLRFLSILMLLT